MVSVQDNAGEDGLFRAPSSNRYAWYLFYVLVAFAFWGLRPLIDADEGRYAEASRGLIESGGWLVPVIGGEPHLTKPPMVYWLIATGLKIFGDNAWGARFFLSAAFLVSIVCVAALSRAWGLNERDSHLTGAVYATSALPFIAGHLLTTDMFLTAAEVLGVLCAWKAMTSRLASHRWQLGFWLSFALAFTIKGPPGWMPLIPLAIFWFLRRRRIPSFGEVLFFIGGATLMLSVSFAWFAILIHRDPSLWSHFVGDEVIGRLTSTKFKRDNSFWIYLPILLGGMAPWIFLWPTFFRKLWKRLSNHKQSVLTDIELFSFLWVTTSLAIFVVAKSRMPLYVLPLMVPISFWFGRELAAHWRVWLIHPRAFHAVMLFWLVGMLGFVACPESMLSKRTRRSLAVDTMHRLAPINGQMDIYLTDGTIPYTFSFYSGLTVQRREIKDKNLHEFLVKQRSEGREAIIISSHYRLGKAFKANKALKSAINIIAEDSTYAVFELSKSAKAPRVEPTP